MAYEHQYKLLWKVERPEKPMTRDELLASKGDMAASDALFVCSIIYPPDGSLSTQTMGFDGRTAGPGGAPGELSDGEIFKVWAHLAHQLAHSPTLGDGHRALCHQVHETIRSAILSARRRDEGPRH